MKYAALASWLMAASLAIADSDYPNPLPPGSVLPSKAKSGQRFVFDLAMGRRGTFAMIEGPRGLAISREGQLQWTPLTEQIGTHEFQVKLAFDKDATELHRYRIEVEKRLPAATAQPNGTTSACQGLNYGGALPKDFEKLPILRQLLPQKKANGSTKSS